jgi:hypothetical protein
MSLIVVLAIAAGYLALVLFVVAMLTGAKRADEDMERALRAEPRSRSRFVREGAEAHRELAAVSDEDPGARRGAA